MLLPPKSVQETWPAPNYINPVTRGPAVVIVNTVLITLCIIIVVLRVYVRVYIKKWFGLDDVFIIFALLTTMAMGIADNIGSIEYGWDRHFWDVPPEKIEGSLQLAWIVQGTYCLGAHFTFWSLLIFYHRLNKDVGIRWFTWLNYTLMIVVTLIFTIFFFLVLFLCYPVQAYWNVHLRATAKCLNEPNVIFIGSILKNIQEAIICTMPIPLVMRMNIPKRRKYGAAILLSIGYVILIVAVVRLYFIYKMLHSYDGTWTQYPAFLAGSTETHTAVICSCIPAVRPLFSKVYKRIKSNLTRSSSEDSDTEKQKVPKIRTIGSWIPKRARRAHLSISILESGHDSAEITPVKTHESVQKVGTEYYGA